MKKETKEKVMNAVAYGGGGFAGVMGSRMVADGLIEHVVKPATPEAQKNARIAVKGGLALLSVAGLVFIDGTTPLKKALHGACIASIGINAADIAAELSKDSTVVSENTTTGKLMRSALGLGCACTENNGMGRLAVNNVCVRVNPDGSRTTYTSHAGDCPYGGTSKTQLASLNRPSLRMPEYEAGTGLDMIASNGAMMMN